MQDIIIKLGFKTRLMRWISWFFVCSPLAWDLIMLSARDWEKVKICLPGVILMLIGFILRGFAFGVDKSLGNK